MPAPDQTCLVPKGRDERRGRTLGASATAGCLTDLVITPPGVSAVGRDRAEGARSDGGSGCRDQPVVRRRVAGARGTRHGGLSASGRERLVGHTASTPIRGQP